MSLKFKKSVSTFHLGMRAKLTAAICSIVAILLVAGVVSIVEFRRMSTYVSDAIAENITMMKKATRLAVSVDEYNLAILSAVGKADSIAVSGIDAGKYLAVTDTLVREFRVLGVPGADSLAVAYDRYVKVSMDLDNVIVNDFLDTREWFFTTLQPRYDELRERMDRLNKELHTGLRNNSVTFDESFYRSLMPGEVSVLAGIALCLLLLFFILTYYVKPLYGMLKNLDTYRRYNMPYKNDFEGDDSLQELNGAIADLCDENSLLKKRIRESER